MARKQALYRFYGDGGQLLYVGITSNPGMRMARHGATKSWWEDVHGVSIEWYASRPEVAAAEVRAIAVEKPLHNIVRPTIPAGAGIGVRCGHCLGCRDGDGTCDLYRPPPLADDEEPLTLCPVCERLNCLYGLGYGDGTVDGWAAGIRHVALPWDVS